MNYKSIQKQTKDTFRGWKELKGLESQSNSQSYGYNSLSFCDSTYIFLIERIPSQYHIFSGSGQMAKSGQKWTKKHQTSFLYFLYTIYWQELTKRYIRFPTTFQDQD